MFGNNFVDLTQVKEDYFTLALISTVVLIVTLYRWSRRRRYNLPPGPYGLPIVGYLPFLGSEPHRELDRLCKKYGNIIGLYLGRKYVVILGEYKVVKEAFSKKPLLNRPPELFDIIPGGLGIASINGRDWVEQRRYCMHALKDIGLKSVVFENNLQNEVEEIVEILKTSKGEPFHLEDSLISSVSNNVASLLFGYRLPLNDPKRKFLNECIESFFKQVAQTQKTNFIPRWMSRIIKSVLSRFSKNVVEINNLSKYVLNEIEKQKRAKNDGQISFITLYLQEMERNSGNYLKETFTLSHLRGNIQGIMIGGSDTVFSSTMFLLFAMATYPELQDKVQEEIDTVLGQDGRFLWSMRLKLPYVYATVLEGQRWRTVAYLNLSRMTSEDTKICGFDIPKGTTVIANLWALHNDTNYWENPEEFNPERFLTQNREVVLKPDSYLPFSYGKKSCPAETVAHMELLHYFIGIMQNFRVQAPSGTTLDLKGVVLLTMSPVKQKLCFILRK